MTTLAESSSRARARRIGADPDAPWVDRHVPLHAREAGFDLHAAVHVAAGDRPRLAQLCRYLSRPPLGQQRMRRLRDGRIAVALQRPWADGTTHLVFTPTELLDDPAVIHRILMHLGLSTEAGEPLRGRVPPWTEESSA